MLLFELFSMQEHALLIKADKTVTLSSRQQYAILNVDSHADNS